MARRLPRCFFFCKFNNNFLQCTYEHKWHPRGCLWKDRLVGSDSAAPICILTYNFNTPILQATGTLIISFWLHLRHLYPTLHPNLYSCVPSVRPLAFSTHIRVALQPNLATRRPIKGVSKRIRHSCLRLKEVSLQCPVAPHVLRRTVCGALTAQRRCWSIYHWGTLLSYSFELKNWLVLRMRPPLRSRGKIKTLTSFFAQTSKITMTLSDICSSRAAVLWEPNVQSTSAHAAPQHNEGNPPWARLSRIRHPPCH